MLQAKQDMKGTGSVAESHGGKSSEKGSVSAQELLGNDYQQTLMKHGLSPADIEASTLQVTPNAQRYLVNDDDSQMRVDEEGTIRASHTESAAANAASLDDKTPTVRIARLRATGSMTVAFGMA